MGTTDCIQRYQVSDTKTKPFNQKLNGKRKRKIEVTRDQHIAANLKMKNCNVRLT